MREMKYFEYSEILESKAVEVFKDFVGRVCSVVVWITLNIVIAFALLVKKFGEHSIKKAEKEFNAIDEENKRTKTL